MLNYLNSYINKQPLKRISYAEYMQLSLYHPQLVGYLREGEKIGRGGDLITTSNMADIFGGALAGWFSNLVRKQLILPPEFERLVQGMVDLQKPSCKNGMHLKILN